MFRMYRTAIGETCRSPALKSRRPMTKSAQLGGDMTATTHHTDHPDEDTWVVPDHWWARTVPFRGRGPVRPVRPGKNPNAWLRKVQEHSRFAEGLALTAEAGQRELARAARAALAGAEDPDPLGVAASGVTAMQATAFEENHSASGNQLADAWVESYGVVRAAEIGVLAAGLEPIAHHHDRTIAYHLQPHEPHQPYTHPMGYILPRLRAWLAAASDADYVEAVGCLRRLRSQPGSLSMRMATSYLLPTEQDWLDADLRSSTPTPAQGSNDGYWLWHACSATTATQLAALPSLGYGVHENADMLSTVAAHVGPPAAEYLARSFEGYTTFDDRRTLLGLLAPMPSDRAFDLILEHGGDAGMRTIVAETALRFPRRALRLTDGRSGYEPIRRLITAVRPDVAAEFGIASPRAGVGPALPVASPAELPELLRVPPWERDRTRATPAVVACTAPGRPTTLSWQPGEQERWAATPIGRHHWDADWADHLAHAIATPNAGPFYWHGPLLHAPLTAVAPHLATLTADHIHDRDSGAFTRRVIARFGDALADRLIPAVTRNFVPAELLLPVSGAEVTALMTHRLSTKRHRAVALDWFERHLGDGLPEVIPAALGKPGTDRAQAWTVLRALDGSGHGDEIRTAATAFGDLAGAAIEAELAADPLQLLPATVPALPEWLTPAALAPIVLRGTGSALPPEAVTAVCTMLALCSPDGDYAGVPMLIELAEPDSLAEFAWSLFTMWELTGFPRQHSWMLHALGLLGDDDTARRLTLYIRAWPGEKAHTRAVAGLDALVAIGSEIALMQLDSIAGKVKFAGLRTEARKRIDRIAEDREMSADELADLLVPDLGLDGDGTLRLDYGPRSFLVGFDEQLRPLVRDADGTPRKPLPKPGVKDDPDLAPEAHRRFSALRKDAKTIAADQIRRLERAMVDGRRWTAARHRQVFVDHPLLRHLSRRLVWATFDDSGAVTGSFRIAEDRSLADTADDICVLTDDALIGIAHPLHLTGVLGAWTELFADYEILQPFPQLYRQTYALTSEEYGRTLERFDDLTVPTTKVLSLTTAGWERGAPDDNGVCDAMFRDLGDGRTAVIDLDPGILAGSALEFDEQLLTGIRLITTGQPSHRYDPDPTGLAFDDLRPLAASELLRDLENLIH
ncbi:DUF4132 domain-containing protein [Nocardia sp. alder85J]|uniref:DUF4132 domain-containing protein n=1 Tax=Nocardia sp. alder85J TaxID=2862949 RepID=UPI001CD3865F|nr:DUF4132 domain-containing protein [Nocardia sp. alder85J]MCX4094884.1 DUF4132 domain-containing protein [Nocardia sp. alder85J]